MGIWEEALDVRLSESAELAGDVTYHAGPETAPRTLRGVFNELTAQPVTDDRGGRRETRQGLLELPLSDAEGPVVIATDGRAFFEIRGQRWTIERTQRGRANWVVYLELVADQSIRQFQPSTRR